MLPVRTPTRRAVLATALVLLAAPGLAACGSSDEDQGPFGGSKASSSSSSGTKDADALGIPVVATRNTSRVATSDGPAAAAATARAVLSGGAVGNHARVVALVDKKDWRVALAASSLFASPIGAPTLYSDGTKLPGATKDALDALKPTGSEPTGGAQVIRVGDVPRPGGLKSTALAGKDPTALALAIDRYTAAARNRVGSRVLVVSADAPDYAVPAAAWAAKSGDPIAFVHKDRVPANTLRQIKDHGGTPSIYVLGPSTVITPKVTSQLRTLGDVKRMGGPDPVRNAIGFAQYQDGDFGWNITQPGHGFLFARTGQPAAAIAGAPLAASGLHGPQLLVNSPDALPAALRDYLLDVRPGYTSDPTQGFYNRAWITGSEDDVSVDVQSQIDALMELVPQDLSGQGTDPSTPVGARPGAAKKPTPAPSTPTTTSAAPAPPSR